MSAPCSYITDTNVCLHSLGCQRPIPTASQTARNPRWVRRRPTGCPVSSVKTPQPKMVDPPPWPGYVAHTRWPGDGPIYMFEAQAYGPADPDTTYPWGEAGCTSTVLAGSLIDCAPGSALETAIGAGNLGTLGQQALQDAANGGAGGISN